LQAATFGQGRGGNIELNTANLALTNSSQLATSTIGQGNAGNIQVNATDSISLSSGSVLQAATFGQGRGGNITINAGSFSLTDGADLDSSTSGMGNSGRIQITTEGATELSGLSTSIFNNVEAGGVGDSLGISITAQSLSVSDGAQIQTLVRGVTEANPGFGQGNAGDITINVTETVTFTGVGEDSNGRVFSSAAFSNLEAGTTGSAGDIIINASSLSLTDGADLDSSTSGTGNSGRIEIITQGATELAGGDIFNNVEAGGVGDSLGISITAQSLSVSDGTQIQTLVRGTTDHNAVSSNVCVTLSRSMFLKASKTNPKKLVAHGVTFPVYTFFPA
jgi:large exoprotein involved in heme utilization and adhesion